MRRTDDARLPVFSRGFQCPGEPGHFPALPPFLCCRPCQSLVAPRPQPWQLVPSSCQPAGSRARRGRSWSTDIHGSPMCRISQRIRVSWMLLRAKGHSCLSSRLLFSRTNWRRGPEHHVTWAVDAKYARMVGLRHVTLLLNILLEVSPQVKPFLTEGVSFPQEAAPVSFPCLGAGAYPRHGTGSVAHALQPLAGFAQIFLICPDLLNPRNQAVDKILKIIGNLQCHQPQMAAPTPRKDLAPSETVQQ